jgi:hypothetical protein
MELLSENPQRLNSKGNTFLKPDIMKGLTVSNMAQRFRQT